MTFPKEIHIQSYPSPCGDLLLGSYADRLCLCDWTNARHREHIDNRLRHLLQADFVTQPTPILKQAQKELEEYFAGKRRTFDVPLHYTGTDLQIAVWRKLQEIPYGTVLSYAELAHSLHRDRALRAVANAVAANPISIFVPCHRIIGSNRSLTGYAGGIPAKAYLLTRERITSCDKS